VEGLAVLLSGTPQPGNCVYPVSHHSFAPSLPLEKAEGSIQTWSARLPKARPRTRRNKTAAPIFRLLTTRYSLLSHDNFKNVFTIGTNAAPFACQLCRYLSRAFNSLAAPFRSAGIAAFIACNRPLPACNCLPIRSSI